MDSILDTVKTGLGVQLDDHVFDNELVLHINSAIMSSFQSIGIGVNDFFILDSAQTWADYIGADTNLEGIKTLIVLKTRLIFDPPTSSFVIESLNRQIDELTWRLMVKNETETPTV